MITLFLISLLFNCSITDLTDDVVFEYRYFQIVNKIIHALPVYTFDRIEQAKAIPKHNLRANESSAELNRLFYRRARDCVNYAWRLT